MELLTSLAIILLCALLLGSICNKQKIPPLLGFLIVGVVLSPYVLNLISPLILNISTDLRQFALVVILTRAGLSLNLTDLKKNGLNAALLCFVPASFEIVGYVVLGTLILNLSIIDSAILGCVMAAVSPAVIVPRVLKIKEQGFGSDKGISELIMAGASVDDVFVIVLFTALIGLSSGGGFSWNILWQTPVSIVLGIAVGIGVGILFGVFFKRIKVRATIKVLIVLSVSFLFIALEQLIGKWIPYASLLSVISMGAAILKSNNEAAKELSAKYSKIWVFAEILLFVLVGAVVDIIFAISSFPSVILVIVLALIFRTLGVLTSLFRSNLNKKERLFCVIAYSPKATVQAAIGAIPLTLGLASGQIILAAAVTAILMTAPIGAFLIDVTHKKLLKRPPHPKSESVS